MRLFPSSAAILILATQAATAQTTCHNAGFGQVTEINGFAPPAVATALRNVKIMAMTDLPDGQTLVVSRGTRPPGTRAAIHVHEYGGHTCVLSGAITDFVEGMAPSLFPADTCYYMPANTPMTAANLGSEDAVLIDTFIVPKGAPTITIIETCENGN